ncbi:hypothetical protein niasHS_003617 [Heterodera schachtii]|uniref:WH1 domain-containing protein n=1 Tax=Heterodera schachtii TaxID=97005 RepID=A0ABD2KH78_HETSC
MSESLLLSATADVMFYDGSQWIRPDAINNIQQLPDSHHLSNIQLMRSNVDLVFRIVAIRNRDNKRLVNQHVFHRLKYKEATPSFHQWRNEHKQVIGLNFTNEQDAKMFYDAVRQVLDNITQMVSPSHTMNSNGTMAQSNNQQQKAPLSSAPPPPPPPPPPDFKNLLAGKQQQATFADKLRDVKLRKCSAGNGVQKRTVSPSNSVGSSNGSGSVSSKFQSQDLISELSDRLSKRKMTVEASSNANGTPNQPNSQTLPVNNAKGSANPYGRIPSVSSLSSQDDATAGGGTPATAGVAHAAQDSHLTCEPMARPKATTTSSDFERMKGELLELFSNELQNLKRELAQTIRDEVAKLSADRR